MALVTLEGMRFFAHHGLYEEERIIGTHFILDITIETDISSAEIIEEHGMEKVVNTINYETVYEICKIQMKNTQKLLETVLENIIYALKWQFSTIYTVKIRIRKLNPPLGGEVAWSSVEDSEDYQIACGRCGKPLLCYGDNTCWCGKEKLRIHPRTSEMLNTQYKGCLCAKCLGEYAG